MAETVLIVDDEKEIAELVELYLKNEGFRVCKAYNAAQAMEVVAREDVSLALLDVMLPDTDGFTLCRRLRETHLFPIIMLTARTADLDKINGLALGADDYITKPFNPLEVAARVKTQLRRYTQYNAAEPSVYDKDGLYVCGQTSEELFEAVWGEKYLDNNNTVMAHIARLREKLNEPPRKPKFIKTVWGVGYRIDA